MINILHLYYDLLNLYGENANIRAIVHELKRNGIKTKVDFKSLNDKIDFTKYDIVYIGSGDEENILLALEDLKKRNNDIKKYIESNKYLFLTGNSMYLFGSYIKTDTNEINGLKIFDYNIEYLTEISFKSASNLRIVGETISATNLIKEKIIGFQNRCGRVNNIKTPLFKTDIKYSNDGTKKDEGFTYKNVYATENIGPLFIRNPYLLDYFLDKICNEKQIKYSINNELTSKKAYKKYLSN